MHSLSLVGAKRLVSSFVLLSLVAVASPAVFAGDRGAEVRSAVYTVREGSGSVATVRFARTGASLVEFTISRSGRPDHTYSGDLDRPIVSVRVGQNEVARITGATDTADASLATAQSTYSARQLADIPTLYASDELGPVRVAFAADMLVFAAIAPTNPLALYFQAPYSIATGDWQFHDLEAALSAAGAARQIDIEPNGFTIGGCTYNCTFWFGSCSSTANTCVRGCEIEYGIRNFAYWRTCGMAPMN